MIPPLQTIQIQMAITCQEWSIPYLNLSEVQAPAEIPEKLDEINPKIILSSIESISDPSVQSFLHSLEVAYVAVDECQVCFNINHTCCSASAKYNICWFKFLNYVSFLNMVRLRRNCINSSFLLAKY